MSPPPHIPPVMANVGRKDVASQSDTTARWRTRAPLAPHNGNLAVESLATPCTRSDGKPYAQRPQPLGAGDGNWNHSFTARQQSSSAGTPFTQSGAHAASEPIRLRPDTLVYRPMWRVKATRAPCRPAAASAIRRILTRVSATVARHTRSGAPGRRQRAAIAWARSRMSPAGWLNASATTSATSATGS